MARIAGDYLRNSLSNGVPGVSEASTRLRIGQGSMAPDRVVLFRLQVNRYAEVACHPGR
jgi:hypothetical protein